MLGDCHDVDGVCQELRGIDGVRDTFLRQFLSGAYFRAGSARLFLGITEVSIGTIRRVVPYNDLFLRLDSLPV